MDRNKKYKRLSGNVGNLMVRHSLWLGPDHVLAVQSSGYSEHYLRFYYEDIQAVCTTRTSSRAVAGWILAALAALFLLLGGMADEVSNYILGFLGGIFFIMVLVNLAMGPTCKTFLYTAVQKTELPSLNRLPRARKALARIRAEVHRVQGELGMEALVMGSQSREQALGAPDIPAPIKLSPVPPPLLNGATVPPYNTAASAMPASARRARTSAFHKGLFVALILEGLSTGLFLLDNNLPTMLFGVATSLAVTTLMVMALTRQSGSDLPGSVRTMTWGALAYVIFSLGLYYVLMLQEVFKRKGTLMNNLDVLVAMARRSPWEGTVIPFLHLAGMAAAFILGGAGLLLMFRHESVRKRWAAAGSGAAASSSPLAPE